MKEETVNIILQAVFIFVFFVFGFIFGLLPFKSQTIRNNQTWNSLANCFAGGVFLSIALLHMLPEAAENFEEGCGGRCAYNWAFLIALLGYTLILFIERVAVPEILEAYENSNSQFSPELGDQNAPESQGVQLPSHATPSKNAMNENEEASLTESIPTPDENTSLLKEKQDKHNIVSPYILLAALTVHSVLEGIAIGLQDGVSKTLQIFFAIFVHEIPEAIALGIALVKMKDLTSELLYKLLLVYALATPIGISIGILIQSTANPFINGVFLALTAGTFVYIAASEVIVEEFSQNVKRWAKFTAFLIGITLISLVIIIEVG